MFDTSVFLNSFLQSTPSACAIWILFINDEFWRSTSLFPWAHLWVFFRCLILLLSQNIWNHSNLKWGPWSDLNVTGKPCLLNADSKLSIVCFWREYVIRSSDYNSLPQPVQNDQVEVGQAGLWLHPARACEEGPPVIGMPRPHPGLHCH